MTARSRLWRLGVFMLVLAAPAGWHSVVTGAHHMGPAREIRIAATDFRFTPRKLTLRPGMYRFVLVNRGRVFHDFQIGDSAARAGQSDEANERHEHVAKAEADPGRTDATTVMLEPGVYRYMCHVPGHEAAGMKGKLVVKESVRNRPRSTQVRHADGASTGTRTKRGRYMAARAARSKRVSTAAGLATRS